MPDAPLPPELDPRGRHRGVIRGGGVGVLRPLARTLGVLLSVGLLVLAGYFWLTFRDINSHIHRFNFGADRAPSNPVHYNGQDQNILLVGNDDRSNMTQAEQRQLRTGSGDGSNSTDTMMIVHIPANGAAATIISLPRDSYVHIPGFQDNKLNAAYVDGYTRNAPSDASLDEKRRAGAALLRRTVENLTGLTVNHYAQVSLLGFYEISNAIGGVPIDLCHSVDDTVAHNRANNVTGGSGFKMSAGKHVIQGVQALEFVRQRHNFPGDAEDLDRVRRQQYFLTAAFRKVASVGILLKLHSLGDAIERNIYLDSDLDLLDLARQLQNLSANHIVGRTIPTKAAMIDGQDALRVNPTKVRAFVQRLIDSETATPASTSSTGSPSAGASTGASRGASRGASAGAPSGRTSATPLDAGCIN